MSWNYRVIKTDHEEPVFVIHEVYYDENGLVKSWSEDPMHPLGESPEELKQDVKLMQAALDRPAINAVDLETGKKL